MSYQKKSLGSKITAKGTELPLLDLKGKPYLQVAHRLVWFREDHPRGKIETEIVKIEKDYAVVKATVSVATDEHHIVVAQAHKTEYMDNFGDFLEKAETGAIGRALAMAGYGTQFDPELDEADRLADSPIEPARKAKKEEAPATKLVPVQANKEPQVKVDRKTLNSLISAKGETIMKRSYRTFEQLTGMMGEYGAKRKDDLTDAQAQEYLDRLNAIIEENKPQTQATA